MTGQSLQAACSDVQTWANSTLGRYVDERPLARRGKFIRDPVHGYHWLEPHEILVLDSPLLQRLRHIHQTGLAYFIYPTAHHTRFDHSLGVCRNAASIVRALADTRRAQPCEEERLVLRMAGLVHDVGHCFFSHLSEEIMESHMDELIVIAKNSPPFAHHDAKWHEILSYWIVTSEGFRKLLDRAGEESNVKLDADRIANLIIGKATEQDAWMADIINGPMDADRLDYIIRDAYFCGHRLDIDVDRYMHSASVGTTEDERRYLCMRVSGIPLAEQVFFSRAMMYPAIYHHQKVRAAECLAKMILKQARLLANGAGRLAFKDVSDYLAFWEHDLFSIGAGDQTIAPYVQQLLRRELPMRCVCLSMHSVDTANHPASFNKLQMLKTRTPEEIDNLCSAIYTAIPAGHKRDRNLLWLDIPKDPDFDRGAKHLLVDLENGTPPIPLAKVEGWKDQDWARRHQMSKWQGHLFYVHDSGCREAAAQAARAILSADHEIFLR